MKISIITVFPELYNQFLNTSLIKRAQDEGLVSFNLIKFSDLCDPKERIDEPVCGHGTGMIIKPEVIERAIEKCEQDHGPGYKIFFSPQGDRLTQDIFTSLQPKIEPPPQKQEPAGPHVILICTRYEGIDERVLEHYADEIISIGDYVLMGGDLPAQVFIEGFLRLIPGIVGKQESVKDESFSGPLLDYPEYGLPKEWKNKTIPEIVLSGDHAKIEQWRQKQACKKTLLKRFDWFRAHAKEQDIALCKKMIPNHYVALMHSEIMVRDGENGQRIGHSSVTSLDLHDIARSSATYGIKNMFMVSELDDQRAIMNDLLTFWKSDTGKEYNWSRYEAVKRVLPVLSRQAAVDHIEQQEGKKPLVITTSAKVHGHPSVIRYGDQGIVWEHDRPVLFLFGTGQGLAESVIQESDYLLVPVSGMTDYRHLSVRSAVGIILDRWLGLH